MCPPDSSRLDPPPAFCYNPTVIIDAHTHVFSPRVISHREAYVKRDPCFALLYGDPRARLVTVQELLVSMDRYEIDTSVIASIGWTSHELCVENNDYILECLARYPQRLVGLAAIQPAAGAAALRELERCVQGGVQGVGEMRPDIQGFSPDEATLAELARYLASRGLVWLSHASEPVGHLYPGKGTLTPEALYPFIQRYPELKIILAHWGGGLPFYALMPEVKAALKNVYFDTAASPYLYDRAVYRQAIDIIGVERVLFGSDYPLMSPSRVLQEIGAAGLPEAARQDITGGNAGRVFNVGGASRT